MNDQVNNKTYEQFFKESEYIDSIFRESAANEKLLALNGDLFLAQEKLRREKNIIKLVKYSRIGVRSLSIIIGLIVLFISDIHIVPGEQDCHSTLGDFVPLYRKMNETRGDI